MNTTRACIIRGTDPELAAIIEAAPNSVTAMVREQFDHNIVELRLEGDALPEWCATRGGNAYCHIKAWVDDGVLYLKHPAVGMPAEAVR